jgi:hypothetical protein
LLDSIIAFCGCVFIFLLSRVVFEFLSLLVNFCFKKISFWPRLVDGLLQFVMTNARKWSSSMWSIVCLSLSFIITNIRCVELLLIGLPNLPSASSVHADHADSHSHKENHFAHPENGEQLSRG